MLRRVPITALSVEGILRPSEKCSTLNAVGVCHVELRNLFLRRHSGSSIFLGPAGFCRGRAHNPPITRCSTARSSSTPACAPPVSLAHRPPALAASCVRPRLPTAAKLIRSPPSRRSAHGLHLASRPAAPGLARRAHLALSCSFRSFSSYSWQRRRGPDAPLPIPTCAWRTTAAT